jgi:glycosyltransferase involved in cell wall biosynthesis
MKVSLFTPCHNTKWLQDAYESIKEQDFYEWIILYNNHAQPLPFGDPRVKTLIEPNSPEWVGPLKAKCCEATTGDILLELDHDDLLTPDAIAEVKLAFADPEVGFVYSNTIHCTEDFKPVKRYNEIFGWRYRPYQFRGITLDEHISFPPEPSAISRIWYAPNHLRAFRKRVYDAVGGYNKEMRILDDLDLMCRLYAVTKFVWIDKGLYFYREHGNNTYIRYNAEIQNNVYRIHDRYIEMLAEKWADDRNLQKLELGGRIGAKAGYRTVDLYGADVIADLNQTWPFAAASVGVVRAMDIFEHLPDSIHTMLELYRILAPGGYAFIQVPSTDGRGAFQDPTHKSFWNENSFLYYTDRRWNQYINCPVRFQSLRCYTTDKNNDGVCWTISHLMKLGTSRVPGIVAL